MSSANTPPVDSLASLADAATQKLAAQMAQDIFAGTFRLAADPEAANAGAAMAEVEARCDKWRQAAGSEDAQALRLAMLIGGLDQWGLAYCQAFNLTALPALTALLGGLRQRLDAKAEARFQWFFSQIEQIEADAIDFKIELRRSIHLALWHAMAACESLPQAKPILEALGGLLLALNEKMPTLGWRLVADALASIQIGLLNAPEASEVAEQGTQELFEALRRAMPAERYQAILAHSGQVVVAWQQARRAQAAVN